MKLTVRHLFRGQGQHRAPARREFPPAAFGAAVTQAFRHCPQCGVDTAAVLHPGGAHTCTEGHTTPAGDAR